MNYDRTDHKLLEMAAKAAGIPVQPVETKNVQFQGDDQFLGYLADPDEWRRGWFNPLANDDDALHLAAMLRISISYTCTGFTDDIYASAPMMVQIFQPVRGDVYAATRRAIVRAASQMALDMEDHHGMA